MMVVQQKQIWEKAAVAHSSNDLIVCQKRPKYNEHIGQHN
jgi:hypothetical protein